MSASHNNYKYPRDKLSVERRAITQRICDDCGVTWKHKFRQSDLLEMIKKSLGTDAESQNGACQIFTTMFMHLREMNKDYPNVARRLFKYWVFMNDKKLQDVISAKTITDDEKEEWKRWKASFGKSDNNNDTDADEYQKFMSMYFASGGGRQIINKINEYWHNYQSKLVFASQRGEDLVEMQISQGENNQRIFTEGRVRPNSNSAFDLDFMHNCNSDYFLDSNRSYKGKIDDLAEAMAYEIYDSHHEEDELRLLVTIVGVNGEHSISFTRFKDDPNYIEFCDANRGEFLIPYNNREMFKEFFKKYFSQDIYKSSQFNSIFVESYGSYPPEQRLDPKIQRQMQNIDKRAGRSSPAVVRNAGSPSEVSKADVQLTTVQASPDSGTIGAMPKTMEKSTQSQSVQPSVNNNNNNTQHTAYPGLLFNGTEKNAGEPVKTPMEEFVQAVDAYLTKHGVDVDSLQKGSRAMNVIKVGGKIIEMKNNDATFKAKFEKLDEDHYFQYKQDFCWNTTSKKPS